MITGSFTWIKVFRTQVIIIIIIIIMYNMYWNKTLITDKAKQHSTPEMVVDNITTLRTYSYPVGLTPIIFKLQITINFENYIKLIFLKDCIVMCKRAIISAVFCAKVVRKIQPETSKPSINRYQQYPKRYNIYILLALFLRIFFHKFCNYCGKFCNYKLIIAIPKRDN